jgi:hypothetical protein
VCGHKTEQAEVPAAQSLSGRDFTLPRLSKSKRVAHGQLLHAAETMSVTYTNGVGISACFGARAEPKIATGG